ncbi:unnamed protein product [Ophioblennius macclurei]
MAEEDEAGRRTRTGFEEFCRDLNLDQEASREAWSNFRAISNTFTLEGSERQWLACSLYASCRSSVPTVGSGTSQGNYVSVTRILRCADMSLMEFFRKMRQWQDMAQLTPEFRRSTDRLERTFTVSALVFQKFIPVFASVFRTPRDEAPPRAQRGRKHRRHPCTIREVFNFCWLLFVHAKGNFPMIGDDVVNSFHLLLCVVDLVFTNALLSQARKDLLNPDFPGLPADFRPAAAAAGSLCFLRPLCEMHGGLLLEAKGVKEHFWKPLVRKMLHRRILRGKEDTLSGLLDPVNFGDSFLSLSRLYEDHILASGGLDERIFTGEGASEDIGSSGLHLCQEGAKKQEGAPCRMESCPLTERRCTPELSLASPLWSAMRSVGRLLTLLSGSRRGASPRLKETLRKCSRDPSAAMDRRLADLSNLLSQHLEGGATGGLMDKEVAVRYFHLAEALYYRMLESIIEREKMILGDTDLSCILEQDIFHRSLLVCCFEMVVFSFRPPGNFPNVLRTFRLPAYHFYKVIEVLVRSEQGLFRDLVKHLNQVEEQVLESLAWTSDSPLWDSLRLVKDRVPTCQEVMPPQYLEQSDNPRGGADLSSIAKGVSPSPPTLLDRYSSPPASSVRRRLFVEPPDGDAGAAAKTTPPTAVVTAIPTGQTVVTMATATVTANNGQTVTIPVQGIANESGGITFIPVQVSVSGQAAAPAAQPLSVQALSGAGVQSAASKLAAKATGAPLRKGSVSLFFRKVYHLASMRLRHLCAQLDIGPDLRRRVWTCLEFSLVNRIHLMKDRHLDQLIMCAVYVMAKVSKEERSFQNIMRCYRSQPQACSDVYRSVLISNVEIISDSSVTCQDAAGGGGGASPAAPLSSSSSLLTPQPISSSSTPEENSSSTSTRPGIDGEERGDLILFYNNVYVRQMKEFALRYSTRSPSAGVDDPPPPPRCSSYPALRTGSPRRMLLSSKHSIYVSPHTADSAPSPGSPAPSPRDRMQYSISSSPAQRLREINLMLRTGQTPPPKRRMSLDDDANARKRVCPENHSALLRRLQDVADDRSASH